ncbi:hypothetical protein TSOC_000411, partial [Tetrabaena socialis]
MFADAETRFGAMRRVGIRAARPEHQQPLGQLQSGCAGGPPPCPGAGRVVQLGDLGHSKHAPGSRKCFEYAREYISGFGVPYALITGNHDLEGVNDFESDEDALAAWSQ